MFCKKCGTQLHPQAKFCKKCGTPMAATQPVSDSQPAIPPPPLPIQQRIQPPSLPVEPVTPPPPRMAVAAETKPSPPPVKAAPPPFTSPVAPPSETVAASVAGEASAVRSGGKRWALIVAMGLVVILAGGAIFWWLWGRGDAKKTTGQLADQSVTAPSGMVYVSGGELMMGNDAGEQSERPAHRIAVKPFFIDRNEVTCEEYAQFLAATGHRAPALWVNGRYPDGAARQPVTNVDWDDANAYAAWAGKRLPTEQEWEFAARGPDGRRYPWGNEWEPDAANADASSAGQMVNVSAHPAGASPFGVSDMAGNAWEWTASDWVPYPGGTLPAANQTGPLKVIRGGCYLSNQSEATTTFRVGWPARGAEYKETGFRCAKDIPAGANVTGAGNPSPPASASSPVTIGDNTLAGIIKNNDALIGCGCYFNPATETNPNSMRYVFLASLEDGKSAWMNIDGKDVKLRLTRSTEAGGKIKVGSRSTGQYVAGDIAVGVEKVVVKLCPASEEDCEVTDYEATITVNRANRTQTVKAKGGCGC